MEKKRLQDVFSLMVRQHKLMIENQDLISAGLSAHLGQDCDIINIKGDGWAYVMEIEGNEPTLSLVSDYPVDRFLKEKDRRVIMRELLSHTF